MCSITMHMLSGSVKLCRLLDHKPCSSVVGAITTSPFKIRQVWSDTPGHVASESAFYDSTIEQVTKPTTGAKLRSDNTCL